MSTPNPFIDFGDRMVEDSEDQRDFEVRRTALLAAAAIVPARPARREPGYDGQDAIDLARKFEPYLRGER